MGKIKTVLSFLVPTLAIIGCKGPIAPENQEVTIGDILKTEKSHFSQGREELIIRDFFKDRHGGVFVDVGCAHYKKDSTTYYLEKYLGWSGIGIDALEVYREEYEKERPNTSFFQYIITDHSGPPEPFYRSSITGWSSVFKEHANTKGNFEIVEVPAITLTDLLDQNGITRIDLLSMDIECNEPAALAGFDIDRFQPELVCIEAAPCARESILYYFRIFGYERIKKYGPYDHSNWYFRPDPSEKSILEMSTMLLERIRYDASQKMRYYKKADSTEKEQYTPSQKEKVPGVIRFDE